MSATLHLGTVVCSRTNRSSAATLTRSDPPQEKELQAEVKVVIHGLLHKQYHYNGHSIMSLTDKAPVLHTGINVTTHIDRKLT